VTRIAYAALIGFLLFIYFEPTFLFPALAQLRAALVMSLLALAAAVLSGARLPSGIQNWLFAFFTVWGAVATWAALSFDLSSERFPVLFKAVALYVVVAMIVRSRERILQFVNVNILLGGIVSITTILTMRAGIEPLGGGDMYRMVNYFGGIGDDPNEFGAFMLALLPLPLLLMSFERSKLKKALFAAVALAVLLCVIRTRSRGAFIGLAAMAPMLMWESRRRSGQIVVGVLMLLYAYTNTHSGYWDRIATTFSETAIQEDFSASSRLFQVEYAQELISQRPLFGVGPGNFVIGKIQLLGHDPDGELTWVAAHNAYFGLGAEVGIPGIIAFLATILVTFRSLRLSERAETGRPEDEQLRVTAKALRIGLVGFCVAIYFLSEQYNPILYMWVAVSASLRDALKPEPVVAAKTRAVFSSRHLIGVTR
jgi:probable O-glycosylation ligase (exosortase A-associated)